VLANCQDKDDVEKRNHQFERQVERELDRSESCELVSLSCAACAQFVLKVRVPFPKTFAHLPRRPVDHSIVVDTNKFLVEVQLDKGEERAIKRCALM
jgi:hypothetical protein